MTYCSADCRAVNSVAWAKEAGRGIERGSWSLPTPASFDIYAIARRRDLRYPLDMHPEQSRRCGELVSIIGISKA